MPDSNSKDYKTKRDVVVELIREAIVSAEFKPGDRVLQEEIAKRLNISPTPVREALRQLEAEGVLDHSPHRGMRVAEIKFEDVREIYLMREALEALATREAVPHLTPENVASLRQTQASIDLHIAEGNLAGLRKLNSELHMAIYSAADLPELYRLIRNLWTKFPWDTLHVLPGRAGRSAHEHHELIEAIAAGEALRAAQWMQTHIANGAQSLMEYLAAQSAAETTPPSPEAA